MQGMTMKYCLLFLLFPLLAGAQQAPHASRLSLNGEWILALDPVKTGERSGWYDTGFVTTGFDKVKVPHSYTVDKRYMFYTGTAWYFKKFPKPVLQPGYRAFLRFDAVFYKTTVWLNGQKAGTHEGGYTPFEIDVTTMLQPKNVLALSVNNEWDTTTIPGAKTTNTHSRTDHSQLFPWMNYGGITRPVHLIIRPDVFIQRAQVISDAGQSKGNARIRINAFLHNLSSQSVQVPVTANIYFDGKPCNIRFKPVTASVQPNTQSAIVLEGLLPASAVKYWNPDEPHLYRAEVLAARDTLFTSFGIRSVKVQGTQILLNGEPIRRGGCNRPLDYPGYGSLDPQEVLEKDLTLIKQGNMDFSRISHYPVSEELLDWADQHGMLIIAEAGNWQLTPKQMADPLMREKFQSQMKEMMERDWNHPCIIAYSLGNEFQAQTPEGQAWVKDMYAFVKTIDTTRLITFATYTVWRDNVKKPADEASQYVDFISANIYGNHLKLLQRIHELYPNKPIYISEFGLRVPQDKNEEPRVAYFKKALQDIRQCDYVAGASVWTFNDYLSRFPGTDADGYRAWGIVAPDRQPRSSYRAVQEEFAPLTIEQVQGASGKLTIAVQARADFPAYTLRNYQLQYGASTIRLNTLKPGERQQVVLPVAATGSNEVTISIINPKGFVVLSKVFKQ